MDIAVIIPVYNRVATLGRAIESVLAQRLMPHEIIVVDDGSDDASSEVVKQYDSVMLLRQKNMGVSAARNNGVMMASSEWVVVLDSDATWHPHQLERQSAFHQEHPHLRISYTDEQWVRHGTSVNLPQKFRKSNENLYERSLEQCIIAPSSVMMQKKLFETVGGFDESLEVCEDYDLWLRLLQEQTFGLISEKLITKYGGHDDQLSTKFWGMDRFRVRALENLHVNFPHDRRIVEMLIHKYRLLLQGAHKYHRREAAHHYEQRLLYFQSLFSSL